VVVLIYSIVPRSQRVFNFEIDKRDIECYNKTKFISYPEWWRDKAL